MSRLGDQASCGRVNPLCNVRFSLGAIYCRIRGRIDHNRRLIVLYQYFKRCCDRLRRLVEIYLVARACHQLA
jgi:hypothetical protein